MFFLFAFNFGCKLYLQNLVPGVLFSIILCSTSFVWNLVVRCRSISYLIGWFLLKSLVLILSSFCFLTGDGSNLNEMFLERSFSRFFEKEFMREYRKYTMKCLECLRPTSQNKCFVNSGKFLPIFIGINAKFLIRCRFVLVFYRWTWLYN